MNKGIAIAATSASSEPLAASLMTQPNTIAQLKSDLNSSNPEIAQQACDRLVEMGGQEVTDFFISILDLDNARLRDLAALALHDIADNKALEPLLKAIKKPEYKNNYGTMAYALEALDCSKKLPEIFDLLFYGDAEVKMAAATILDEQTFDTAEQDVHSIQTKWQDIKSHPDKCPYLDDYKDTIEYYLDRLSTIAEKKASR